MSEDNSKQNGATVAADKNAAASADAGDLLAKLQAKAAAAAPSEKESENKEEKKDEENRYGKERRGRDHDRERHDRRDGKGFNRGGRGGRGGFQKRNNNKFDPSNQTESDDPIAIRKQVEFYFSDSNLPLDKFLLNKVGGVENNPVELDIICSFKRMRHFQPRTAIVAALKESSIVELVEDDTKVKRKVPLSAELADGNNDTVVKVFEDRAMPRSIYVKGFGEEQPSTQFDIEAFFAPYGPTNAIRLRRKDHDKSFKGSVFVEFDSEETMNKFMELDPKPEYKGKTLQIMSKKEYCDGKAADISAGKIRASSPRGAPRNNRDDRDWRDRRRDDNRRGGGRGRGFGHKGGRDRRDGRDRNDRNRDRDSNKENGDKDTANSDAVAKARAVVEAEKAKENGDAVAGQKRSREDAADGAPEAKKVDAKSDS